MTIGYSLGYVIAPPIKNSFDGWYYVFYFEAVACIPFIIISAVAYKDPSLIFKKEVKVPIMTQFKLLSKNPVYILLVIGYGAYAFTVGGIAYWGPSILQHQFDQSEAVASFSLGGITIISGLVATVLGSVMYDKMIASYRVMLGNKEISENKFNNYRTEKGAKYIVIVSGIACAFALLGAIIGPTLGNPVSRWPFIFFLFFIGIGEFFLFL